MESVEKRTSKATRPEGNDASLAALLHEVGAFLGRFLRFASRPQQTAVTLWVVHTHVFDQFETTPYLAITSPMKQSGKSRLFDVLALFAARAWLVITPSEAVVFRKIDASSPTLLLDEVDAIYGQKKGEHAGHRRGATVPRCVGQDFRVKDFKVYSPKAFAGIGNLPSTVADRSIPIHLQRKRRDEEVEKFQQRKAALDARPIHDRLVAWAASTNFAEADPAIPPELSDRAGDGWEPLLAIPISRAKSGPPLHARQPWHCMQIGARWKRASESDSSPTCATHSLTLTAMRSSQPS
jgi:hypothetical protein